MSRSASSYPSRRDAAGTGGGCPSRGRAGVRGLQRRGASARGGGGLGLPWVGTRPPARGTCPRGLPLPSGASGGVPGCWRRGREAGSRRSCGRRRRSRGLGVKLPAGIGAGTRRGAGREGAGWAGGRPGATPGHPGRPAAGGRVPGRDQAGSSSAGPEGEPGGAHPPGPGLPAPSPRIPPEGAVQVGGAGPRSGLGPGRGGGFCGSRSCGASAFAPRRAVVRLRSKSASQNVSTLPSHLAPSPAGGGGW